MSLVNFDIEVDKGKEDKVINTLIMNHGIRVLDTMLYPNDRVIIRCAAPLSAIKIVTLGVNKIYAGTTVVTF